MNVRELAQERLRGKVSDLVLIIDGLTSPSAAEGVFCIMQKADHWEVGVEERGHRAVYDSFPDEHSACTYALSMLDDGSRAARPWWLRWS